MTGFLVGDSRPRRPRIRAWLQQGLLAGFLCAIAAGPAASAESLRWKLKAGESLRYTMVQEISQQMKLPDRDLKQTTNLTVNLHWSVKSVASDGVAEMTQTIDRVRLKVDAPDTSFEFDSQNPKGPEGPIATQLTPLLKALVGVEFNVRMNPRGQFIEVKVPQKLVESLRQAGPPGAAGGMLSEEGIKNLISQVSLTFPEEDLEKGKSWSSRSRFPIPKVGTLVMDRTFTYQGSDPKAADLRQVSLKSSVKLEPTGDSNEAVKITSHDGKGEFTFDPQAGRILSTRVNDLLRMTLSVQGQDLEQTTETVTTMTLARDGQPK
ncbi:MAG: DUF6263 family protein [Isosphaeraceae bacterium]